MAGTNNTANKAQTTIAAPVRLGRQRYSPPSLIAALWPSTAATLGIEPLSMAPTSLGSLPLDSSPHCARSLVFVSVETATVKVLVVGSGAREHALVWKCVQSDLVERVYCAPGNGGTGGMARNVPIGGAEVVGVVDFAK